MANCCNHGETLTKEYDNALKFEAITYGRLIAHKRRHEAVGAISRVRYLRMVIQAAEAYADGDVEAHGEIPSAVNPYDDLDRAP